MSNPVDLTFLSISELTTGYAAGTFTPVDVAEQALDRAETVGPLVNAMSLVDRPRALKQARVSAQRWDAGDPLGPLDGVPLTVKDSFAAAGWPTTSGSLLSGDPEPETVDSPAVARVREAGAVLLGKTTMPEYGWSAVSDGPRFGLVRNAWDREKTSGGSTGGGAAAVALGIGAGALGTDGGGSIRIPASFNGVVGFKPTFGRVPLGPDGHLSRSTHAGPLGRSVADVAAVLGELVKPDNRDPNYLGPTTDNYPRAVSRALTKAGRPSAGVKKLRVAYSLDFGHQQVRDDVAHQVLAASAALARSGVHVEASELYWPDLSVKIADVWATAIATGLNDVTAEQLELLSPELQETIHRGRRFTAVEHLTQLAYVRNTIALALHELFGRVDVLLTPTMPITAFAAGRTYPPRPSIEERFNWNPFTWPLNLTGHPALTVPVGLGNDGMPVGLQIIARHGHDVDALAVGAVVEKLVDFPQTVRSRFVR